MKQVSKYMALVPKELTDWVIIGRKQDLSFLEKDRIGKVIRKYD